MIHFRAKLSNIHLVFYEKSHVETGLTECGKKLAEPVNALAMTSSEQWHTNHVSGGPGLLWSANQWPMSVTTRSALKSTDQTDPNMDDDTFELFLIQALNDTTIAGKLPEIFRLVFTSIAETQTTIQALKDEIKVRDDIIASQK